MSVHFGTETSSCASLEMLPLSPGTLIENITKSHKKMMSSFMSLPTPSMEREAFVMRLHKNKVSTGAESAFDIPSTNIRILNGDLLENHLKSSLELYSAPSTLSLNEEAFINEINKIEQINEDNSSAIKQIHSCPLNGMDVIFGTAKLVQSTIEAHAVRIVPLTPSKKSERSKEDEFQKGDAKFPESPRVSFRLPKDTIREVISPASDSVVPPNWSPCNRYTARHWKKNIQPTPRTPYNSLTPSER